MHQKIMKIAKIVIWAENSIFDTPAGIGRNDDIWPEMDSWGVLELFCTRKRHLNSFRSNFRTFWKNRFFGDFDLWDHQKWTRRIFYGSRNFDPAMKIGLDTSKLFSKKKCRRQWDIVPEITHFFWFWGMFPKTHLKLQQPKVLFLLLFWVPRCCFSKTS